MAALADPTASSGSCLVPGVALLIPQLIADPKWGEEEIAPPGPREYSDMCRVVYEESGDERAQKAAELAAMEGGECMLYMNFKSHAIFGEEQRGKLFEVIRLTNPSVVCLSEALVPVALATHAGQLCELSTLVEDPENRIEQPYMAGSEVFATKKLGQYGGSPKVMQGAEGGWFEEFIKLGFEWVVFLSPTHCPYGRNWGNCMVMKHKPDEVRCGNLERLQYKKVWDASESRCYVGARYGDHITVSVHLDDVPAGDVRTAQAEELGQIVSAWRSEGSGSDGGEAEAAEPAETPAAAAAEGEGAAVRTVTLVGDMNAINPDTYNAEEIVRLNKYNRGKPCPTDAIDALTAALGVVPLNTGQKFECRFNKCVTHAYSTHYTHYLDLLTDATDFDHQPLALYRLE